jgi:hypothetical protein
VESAKRSPSRSPHSERSMATPVGCEVSTCVPSSIATCIDYLADEFDLFPTPADDWDDSDSALCIARG